MMMGGMDRVGGSPSLLDADAVRVAYRRWAGFYDQSFGWVTRNGRKRAAQAVNRLPGSEVLEVGVGTGLALPHYAVDKHVTGIDLSADMLEVARRRVAARGLANVVALRECDAEDTGMQDGSFDIAVAMYVASVVPNPRLLMRELRRLVRPGGHILLINHFAAEAGPRLWVERAMAPAARALGWHPDFPIDRLVASRAELAEARQWRMPPLGLFTLLHIPN
jgi:phosphatidylethanolamine/phosphatidyl-N-methylethanolamine N-methyltransferase